MNKKQAIQLLQKSDLPEADKQRLIQLVEDKGWNNDVQAEVLAAIRNAATDAKSQLADVTKKTETYEAKVAAEDKQLADEATAQMDQAVSDYNQEMAKLEQEADQLAADAKKSE